MSMFKRPGFTGIKSSLTNATTTSSIDAFPSAEFMVTERIFKGGFEVIFGALSVEASFVM